MKNNLIILFCIYNNQKNISLFTLSSGFNLLFLTGLSLKHSHNVDRREGKHIQNSPKSCFLLVFSKNKKGALKRIQGFYHFHPSLFLFHAVSSPALIFQLFSPRVKVFFAFSSTGKTSRKVKTRENCSRELNSHSLHGISFLLLCFIKSLTLHQQNNVTLRISVHLLTTDEENSLVEK